jgi:uncharacterized Ntn-hydrolase superfamily protein
VDLADVLILVGGDKQAHGIGGRGTRRQQGQAARAVIVIDAGLAGDGAHTGAECLVWCGHLVKESYSVAGNILAGPGVLEAMVVAYEAATEMPLAQKLVAAMKAGEQAGGDKRGRQSAALLIHGNSDWALLDIRVDDHTDPISELARLEQIARSS